MNLLYAQHISTHQWSSLESALCVRELLSCSHPGRSWTGHPSWWSSFPISSHSVVVIPRCFSCLFSIVQGNFQQCRVRWPKLGSTFPQLAFDLSILLVPPLQGYRIVVVQRDAISFKLQVFSAPAFVQDPLLCLEGNEFHHYPSGDFGVCGLWRQTHQGHLHQEVSEPFSLMLLWIQVYSLGPFLNSIDP